MISPMTPAGTKIVAIEDSRGGRAQNGIRVVPPKIGEVYVAGRIYPAQSHCGFAVLIPELTDSHGYCLTLFRRLDLPECLTDLLQSKPVDALVGQPADPVPLHSIPASSLPATCVPADASASVGASAFSRSSSRR